MMTIKRKEKVQCSNCGKVFTVTIWDSINIQLDPKLKKAILEYSFLDNKCPKCKTEIILNYRFLYHDDRYMFWFVPFEIPNEDELIDDIEDSIEDPNAFIYRLVGDQYGLAEKINIFDRGLDDRIVEVYKHHVFANYIKQYPDAKIMKIIFFVSEGRELFHIIHNDGRSDFILFNMDSYRYYDENFGDLIRSIPLEKCPEVRQDFAKIAIKEISIKNSHFMGG